MKNLIYSIIFLVLSACMDENRLIELKNEVKSNLGIVYQNLQETNEKKSEKENKKLKYLIRTQKLSKRTQKYAITLRDYLKKIKNIYAKNINILEQKKIKVDYKKIYQAFRKRLFEEFYKDFVEKLGWRNKDFQMLKKSFQNAEVIQEFLDRENNEEQKEIVQLQMGRDLKTILYWFFSELNSGHGWDKMVLLGNNKLPKLEEGEFVEIEQFITIFPNIKKYDYNIQIDKGKIQEEDNRSPIFSISIPAQKLGKQDFTVTAKFENWETEQDITLYFREFFEVVN